MLFNSVRFLAAGVCRVESRTSRHPDESDRHEDAKYLSPSRWRLRLCRFLHVPDSWSQPLCGCARVEARPPPTPRSKPTRIPTSSPCRTPSSFLLVEVGLRKVTDELHVNGVIAPDVNRSVPVVSLGGGRVVEIKAKLGDSVRKGQTLLLIDSPDLSQAFSDYQKFKADEQLAAKQLARAQLLYDKGAIALADLETAQDAEAKAKVDLQTAAPAHKSAGRKHQQPLAAAAGGRANLRDHRRPADHRRHWREVARQLAQPVHHRRPVHRLGGLRRLRRHAVAGARRRHRRD